MRDIKFRVWNTNLNRFMREDEKNDNYMDVTTGKLVSNCYSVHEYGNATEYYNNGSYKLLQFTGLLDKQGVEIYEGDIVAYDLGFDDEKPENYKIVFDNKQCAYFMFPLNDKSRLRHFTYSAKNDCEVIGNIYENPELLN